MRISIQDYRIGEVTDGSAMLSGTNLAGRRMAVHKVSEGFGAVNGDRNQIVRGRYGACADLSKEAEKHGRQEEG